MLKKLKKTLKSVKSSAKSGQKSAFSLIEISVVILIIAILAAGAISVSTVALNNAKAKVSRDRIGAIYKAIGNYVAKNHRLPCPASLKLTKSEASYGVQEGAGDCATAGDGIYSSQDQPLVIYGMVPTSTLGLSDDMAEDGFGGKIAYVVNANFTVADYPDDSGTTFGFGFADDTGNDMINIYQLPSTNSIDDVALALISHGGNKYGAFNAYSSTQNSTTGSDVYELKNSLTGIVNNVAPIIDTAIFGTVGAFAGRVTFTVSNSNSDVFDDIVFFKKRSEILSDFDLGFLLPCTATTLNWETGYSNAFAGTIKYRATACAAPNDGIRPSKECAPFAANWINKTTCP